MEVLDQLASGENPLMYGHPGSPVPSSSKEQLEEHKEPSALHLIQTKANSGLNYLFDCYSRVAVEERNQPKVNF